MTEHAWMLTLNGVQWDLLNPDASKVCLEDIIVPMAGIYRYGNHARTKVDILWHSLLVHHRAEGVSKPYHYRKSGAGPKVLKSSEILHVYADSDDGITGLSMVQVAANAIELAGKADKAAQRLFDNGMMVGGALTHPERLSQEAHARLEASLSEKHKGTENVGKWMLLEEGMTAKAFASTAHDAQQLETRKHQVEEIGRAFGVPRPFLGLDDTSWGSGVDVLGQIFVRYALNPWFTAWEQAAERSLLTDKEQDKYSAKFNAGALIRGNMKDQSEFFAKALGSGGHQPWMTYEEVRTISDLPEKEIGPNPMAMKKDTQNEPSQTS
ncbi:MAG: phage portal protein [Rhodobacteraceae bacterium]|nr:phage portal protein [Paracoccaceae bacterium]